MYLVENRMMFLSVQWPGKLFKWSHFDIFYYIKWSLHLGSPVVHWIPVSVRNASLKILLEVFSLLCRNISETFKIFLNIETLKIFPQITSLFFLDISFLPPPVSLTWECLESVASAQWSILLRHVSWQWGAPGLSWHQQQRAFANNT